MSDNNDDELRGFREFIEGANLKEKRSPKSKKNTSLGHELLTFLEYELKRLDLRSKLHSEKVFILKEYSHQEKIRDELDQELNERLEEIFMQLKDSESGLFKSLDQCLKEFRFV